MGIGHWRGLRPPDAVASHGRSVLFFPRKASRFSFGFSVPGSEAQVTSSQMLFMPSHLQHRLNLLSPSGTFVSLFPSGQLWDEMILENKIPTPYVQKFRVPFVCKLSRWMDDLIDRYRFERLQNQASPLGCPSFLEKQMMNEFARLCFPEFLQTTGEVIGNRHETQLDRILNWIETQLFSEFDLETMASKLKLSVSQINRIFLAETNQTPKAFIQNWRLEEAARLIERKDHSVTDIAFIAGYGDLSSFSKAFKKRFGVAPLSYPKPI
jgi:AraC-like DNA-binding protein